MTTLKKRSIVIGGRQTSIALEESFWMSLQQIARHRQVTISNLIASLDAAREDSNLSSTIRVFILNHYRAMAAENLRQAVLEWANGTRELPLQQLRLRSPLREIRTMGLAAQARRHARPSDCR